MDSDELVNRIAKAMYLTMAHVYDWELAREDHKEIYRKEARAAITEFVAIANLRTVFPEIEPVGSEPNA